MKISEILNKGIEYLKNNNITDPILKARLILAFTLNEHKEYLVINSDKELNKEDSDKYLCYINLIATGEPMQHITGKQEFMRLGFIVNKDVLIPRQDTEILVEEVIKITRRAEHSLILDLCTGSGAIAVSLAKYGKNAEIVATDISQDALLVAIENAKINNVSEKINFIKSNLFESIPIENKFDIIVSNPPYIESKEITNLDKEVQKEPLLALDGGESGLEFYEKIISEADKYLAPKGYLCFEIGYNQKDSVVDIIGRQNKYINIYSKKDLSGNNRIVVCEKKGE